MPSGFYIRKINLLSYNCFKHFLAKMSFGSSKKEKSSSQKSGYPTASYPTASYPTAQYAPPSAPPQHNMGAVGGQLYANQMAYAQPLPGQHGHSGLPPPYAATNSYNPQPAGAPPAYGTQYQMPPQGQGTQYQMPPQELGTQYQMPPQGQGTQYQMPPQGQGTQYQMAPHGTQYQMPPSAGASTVVVKNGFDAGARFTHGSTSLPPPPPGVMPSAAQIATAQGHNVVVTQRKGNYMTGGSGGGYTIW